MKRRPRDIGTAAESAVVRAIQARGFTHAERRALRGALDAGDITGTPGICWSVKGGAAARTASDGLIDVWLSELDDQAVHANADVAVLVVQRAGVGAGNAHRWWAIMRAYRFEQVASRTNKWTSGFWFPVRMTLENLCDLLHAAGYGTADDPPQWAVDHPGLGIYAYHNEDEARDAAGTAGTLLHHGVAVT